MNVKEMLQNGTSAEEMRAMLDKEITQAEKEIKAETASKESNHLDELRDEVISSILCYLDELGIIPEHEIPDETYDEMVAALKELEPIIAAFGPLMDALEKIDVKTENKDKDNDMAIINAFLKTLV